MACVGGYRTLVGDLAGRLRRCEPGGGDFVARDDMRVSPFVENPRIQRVEWCHQPSTIRRQSANLTRIPAMMSRQQLDDDSAYMGGGLSNTSGTLIWSVWLGVDGSTWM